MPKVDHAAAQIGIYTFGQKSHNFVGTCQYYINVAGLRDPGSSGQIRSQYVDGRAGGVQQYIADDVRVKVISEQIRLIAYMHLRSQAADNKWLSFGLVDYHGRWIAPAIGEIVADNLSDLGYSVSLYHADLVNPKVVM
jgi:hypothetical protein